MGLFDRFKRTSKESLLGYLQNSISDNSSLEHIVSMFEEMCNMPLKEDMILFETGTYSFTGKPMFNFSLVRQFSVCITKISTFLILCDLAVCLATLYVSFSLVFALMRYLQGKVFLIRFYSPTTLSSSRAEFRLPSRLACA